MHSSVRFQVAAVLIKDHIVVVVLILRGATLLVVDSGSCHQLLVDIT